MPRIKHELVFELRSRYKLAAYTHTMKFDHRAEGSNKAPGAANRQVRYRFERNAEIAVLVGDYQGVEDPRQKTLEKLKLAQPDCLDVEKRAKDGKPDSRTLGSTANDSAGRAARGKSGKNAGPCGTRSSRPIRCCPTSTSCPRGSIAWCWR